MNCPRWDRSGRKEKKRGKSEEQQKAEKDKGKKAVQTSRSPLGMQIGGGKDSQAQPLASSIARLWLGTPST
jgi:hypothetical protein